MVDHPSKDRDLLRGKRVAIIHDWLVTYTGAEKVLEAMLELFPAADLYAVCDFLPASSRQFLSGRVVRTSFIQRLPFARSHYRAYLPVMPLAMEQLDLRGYDIIISSSHAVAKGVITGPNQFHLSYIHSPMRYAWDLQNQYLELAGYKRGIKSIVMRYLLHRMRLWDACVAMRVDAFVANSNYISRRIMKCYRRKSHTVYPPVDTARFALCEDKDDYYLTMSRLVPYKRVDIIVKAFAKMRNKKLIVIGDGPEMSKLQHLAKGHKNVHLLGFQKDDEVCSYVQRARAFIFAAEEDFGIAPVEAMACGTPVIAYGTGGACETVRELGKRHPTGVLFKTQDSNSLCEAIMHFEADYADINAEGCRSRAMDFSPEKFKSDFMRCLEFEYANFLQVAQL